MCLHVETYIVHLKTQCYNLVLRMINALKCTYLYELVCILDMQHLHFERMLEEVHRIGITCFHQTSTFQKWYAISSWGWWGGVVKTECLEQFCWLSSLQMMKTPCYFLALFLAGTWSTRQCVTLHGCRTSGAGDRAVRETLPLHSLLPTAFCRQQ